MAQDTRPVELEPSDGPEAWAEFRVTTLQERLRLMRELRDHDVPVVLNAPDGAALPTTLWAVEGEAQRLNFNAHTAPQQLARLVDANEAVAVAYLDNIKLQFDLQGFVLVHGAHASALHCPMPREVYRFQRRNAFRVRGAGRLGPVVRFRHPGMPDMALTLRMLDLSIGGCAIWLPADVPPLQTGTRLGELQVELDADNRFAAPAVLQHLTDFAHSEHTSRGARIGCEWQSLSGHAQRVLQRWIDHAQQRGRRLSTS